MSLFNDDPKEFFSDHEGLFEKIVGDKHDEIIIRKKMKANEVKSKDLSEQKHSPPAPAPLWRASAQQDNRCPVGAAWGIDYNALENCDSCNVLNDCRAEFDKITALVKGKSGKR
jgi:hypothetical protein